MDLQSFMRAVPGSGTMSGGIRLNTIRNFVTMIIFDLACHLGHGFEGWFRSQENFEAQLAEGVISCPQCGSTDIRRVPSAVHVGKSGSSPQESQAVRREDVRAEEMMSLLGQVLSSIIAQTEDVGREFADEARRIHYLESPSRPIRGEASLDEFESLREEGIDVMMFPALKKEEIH